MQVLGPYSVRVTNSNPSAAASTSAGVGAGAASIRPVKLGLQLYRVKEHRYLVDMKYLEGEVYVFFDEAAKILLEMKHVAPTASPPTAAHTNHHH